LGTQQVPIGAGIPVHRHFEIGRSLLRPGRRRNIHTE
jgi:hypothetical protein